MIGTENGGFDSERLLTRKDLCRRWNVKVGFLRKKEKDGTLKATRLSRQRVRYRLEDVIDAEFRMRDPE
ncbi:hypothetical protein BH23VER1_BH23VER1_13440 [soil metagenome]